MPSVIQLLKSTWSKDKKNAVQVRLLSKSLTKSQRKYKLTTKTLDVQKGEIRKHRQTIECLDVDCPTISGAKNIKVSCDCERFTFYFEYALWKRKAADIIYSNGEQPLVTNPSHRMGVCKHLYVTLLWLAVHKK